ncbi:SapB/AmfS family lanthipeptide [Brevibacterium aurantiacum]
MNYILDLQAIDFQRQSSNGRTFPGSSVSPVLCFSTASVSLC